MLLSAIEAIDGRWGLGIIVSAGSRALANPFGYPSDSVHTHSLETL